MGERRLILSVAALVAALLLSTAREARAGAELLSFGEGGVRLGAATTLYAKPVTGAAYDAAQELVWFVSKGTLYVIDLRDAKRKPVAIAKKMPEGAFAVSGLSNASWSTDYAGLFPLLELGAKKIKLSEGAGAYGGIWEENDKRDRKALKKVKVVGNAWLKKQQKRQPRASAAAVTEGGWDATMVLPEGVGECDGGGMECGASRSFGGTGYLLVVTSAGCGDACHSSCLLFDARSKQWASPVETGSWTKQPSADLTAGPCDGYGFHPDGTYFQGSVSCKATSGVQCVNDAAWMHVGWADAELARTPVTAAAPAAGTVAEAMGVLRAMKDKMCRCKDKACADAVLAELEAAAKRYEDLQASKAEEQEATDIATAMMNCMSGLR